MFRRKLGVILAGLMISTSIWGAEESKGSPSSYAAPIPTLIEGLRDRGVRFSVNGQEIAMTRGAMEKFSFFQNLTNFTRAANGQLCVLTAEEEAALMELVLDGNLHLLQLLGCVLAASAPLGLDVPTCIQLILLAQRLGLEDWQHLGNLLHYVKGQPAAVIEYLSADASLLAESAEIEPIRILVERFWLDGTFEGAEADIREIIWQPQGTDFFVKYRDGRAQRYDAMGIPVGTVLTNVYDITWQPQGQGFFVRHQNRPAQQYNAGGEPVGAALANVSYITWQPQGEGFFVVSFTRTAQRYNSTGAPVGERLSSVDYIVWQPQGEDYFVIYQNGTAQRYNGTGASVGALLNNVDHIAWHPQGDGYFVIYQNSTTRRYNAAGIADGMELAGEISKIIWQPQGDGFFVLYNDSTAAQRYDAMGAPAGAPLANVGEILWHPKGDGYFVIYRNYAAQQYDATGAPVGAALANVNEIIWHPEGVEYLVRHHYLKIRHYNRNGLEIHSDRPSFGVTIVRWLPNGQGYVLVYQSGKVLVNYDAGCFRDLRWVMLQSGKRSYRVFINQFGIWLLVQAIANQFTRTELPVLVPAVLQTMFPTEIWKLLNDLGMVLSELAAAPSIPELPVASAAASERYYFSRK